MPAAPLTLFFTIGKARSLGQPSNILDVIAKRVGHALWSRLYSSSVVIIRPSDCPHATGRSEGRSLVLPWKAAGLWKICPKPTIAT